MALHVSVAPSSIQAYSMVLRHHGRVTSMPSIFTVAGPDEQVWLTMPHCLAAAASHENSRAARSRKSRIVVPHWVIAGPLFRAAHALSSQRSWNTGTLALAA